MFVTESLTAEQTSLLSSMRGTPHLTASSEKRLVNMGYLFKGNALAVPRDC
jgi:hypothetical protein